MTAAAVFGSTGLTGAEILSALLASTSISAVHTISRRKPAGDSPKLQTTIEADTSKWAAQLAAIKPAPLVVFSAVGTTRAQAGGIAPQWKIDHDLNIELAKAAREAGTPTFVFVSSAGTRGWLSGSLPYSKMKVGVEDAVRDLDFPTAAIILRPGAILGPRADRQVESGILNGTVRFLGRFNQKLQDAVGQDRIEIARAAVHAAKLAADGKAPSKYWVLEQADIVRLGRTEWPEDKAPAAAATE